VNETGSESCPMAGFCASGVADSDTATRDVVPNDICLVAVSFSVNRF
jgi:hypothetical protein